MSKNTQLGNLVNGIFVNAAGNSVGMGTQTPRASLDVTGNIHARQGCWTTDESLNGGFLIGDLATGTAYTYIGGVGSTGAASYLSLSTNAGEKMRITSAGNVGIGTSSPLNVASSRTSVTINGASTSILSFGSGGVGKGYVYNDGTNLEIYSEGATIFAAGGPPRMRLTSAGNLGIGASTSPTYLLEVSTAGGSQRIRVGTLQNNNNTSTFEAITTASNTTASSGWMKAIAGGTVTFGTSTYVKTGGDSGNFANLSSEVQTNGITLRTDGAIFLNNFTYSNTVSASPRTLYIDSANALGGISSIKESKINIENINNIDWLYKLNPVSFNYRKKDSNGNYTDEYYNELTYGLIAEETISIADYLINYDNNEDGSKKMSGIEYSRLITPMLKAIQELKAEIEILKQK